MKHLGAAAAVYCQAIINLKKSLLVRDLLLIHLIQLLYVRNVKTKEILLIRLRIHQALVVASRVIINISACTNRTCDINMFRIFVLHLLSFTVPTQTIRYEWINTINHYVEKSKFILYLSCMYCLKLFFLIFFIYLFYLFIYLFICVS